MRVMDTDDARTPALEAQLAPLRASRAWPVHDAIWLPAVRSWYEEHAPFDVVFAHSGAHLEALGVPVDYVLWPTEAEMQGRLAALSPERRELYKLNRRDVAHARGWGGTFTDAVALESLLLRLRAIPPRT
jgi:hypothetical protein